MLTTSFVIKSKDVPPVLQVPLICVSLRSSAVLIFFAFYAFFCDYLVFLCLPFAPLHEIFLSSCLL
jgi:hypothetical protein